MKDIVCTTMMASLMARADFYNVPGLKEFLNSSQRLNLHGVSGYPNAYSAFMSPMLFKIRVEHD